MVSSVMYLARWVAHSSFCSSSKAPISLMTAHYRSVADEVHQRYPFFRSTFFERRMLFDRELPIPQIPFRRDIAVPTVHHAA